MNIGDRIPTITAQLPDTTIAQQGDRAIVGMPANTNPQNNIFPELLGAGVGGAVLVTTFFKLFEKYGTNFIDGQKIRLNLEIEAKKLELELKKEERLSEREESKGKDKIIESTINLALSNLAQGARDSHEANYLLAGKLEAANQLNQKEFSMINDRLLAHEKYLQSIDSSIKQIFNVLNMRDRGKSE